MDLKFYDHDGHRWIEGEYEGRWFALNEDGTRLVLETPQVGHGCYEGTTADAFTGHRTGVLQHCAEASAWLFDVAIKDPHRIDRPNQTRGMLTIPIPSAVEAAC